MSSVHGEKIIVEYRQLDSGKKVLVVKAKLGMDGSKALLEERQVVDLNLKNGEQLSPNFGFRCSTKGEKFAYGVISKKTAKKVDSFAPIRAWAIDEENLKLVPVDNAKEVSCVWAPEGESPYPF